MFHSDSIYTDGEHEQSQTINIAKKYGLTPKISSSGKNIGTKIIKISVHSNGHPKRKIII